MGKRDAERRRKKHQEQVERMKKELEERRQRERERKLRHEEERRRRSSSCTSAEYESAEERPSRRGSDSEVSGEYYSSRQSISSEDADKPSIHPGLEDISEVPSRHLEMLNSSVVEELDDVFLEPTPDAPGQPEKSEPEEHRVKTRDVRKKTPRKRRRRVRRAVTPPPDMDEPQREESPEIFSPKSPAWSPRKPPSVLQRFGQLDESPMTSLGRVPRPRRASVTEATPAQEEKKVDDVATEGRESLEQEIEAEQEGTSSISEPQIVQEEEVEEGVLDPLTWELQESPTEELAGYVPQVDQENVSEGIESEGLEGYDPHILAQEDLSEFGAAALLHPPPVVLDDMERSPGVLGEPTLGMSEAQMAILMEDIPANIEYNLPEIILESIQDKSEVPSRTRLNFQVVKLSSEEDSRTVIQRIRFLNMQDSGVHSFDSVGSSIDSPVSQQTEVLMTLSDDTGISSAVRVESPLADEEVPPFEENVRRRSDPEDTPEEVEETKRDGENVPQEQGESTSGQVNKQSESTPDQVNKKKKKKRDARRKRGVTYRWMHGHLGRKIRVKTNCLKLSLKKKPTEVFQYNMKIVRGRPKYLMTNIFRAIRDENFPIQHMTFNGTNRIFCIRNLNLMRGGTSRELELTMDNGQTRRYTLFIWNHRHLKLSLKALRKNELKPMKTKKWNVGIMCINSAMREALYSGYWIRNVCYYKSHDVNTISGRQIKTGYYQKVFTGSHIFVNVDVIKRPFLKNISITSLMTSMDIDINRPVTKEDKQRLTRFLKGLRLVRFDAPGGELAQGLEGVPAPATLRHFEEILDSSTEEVFFVDGLRVTVADFYMNQNFIVRYPHLPAIRVTGECRNDSVWPMEFCMIYNNRDVVRNLTSKQMRMFVRHSQWNTQQRLAELQATVKSIDYQAIYALDKYGIQVGREFEDVDARILNKCNIEYLRRRITAPMHGGWLMTDKQFITSGVVKRLGIFCINVKEMPEFLLERFILTVKLFGRQKGMTFGKGVQRDWLSYDVGKGNRQVYLKLRNFKACDLVLVVLPRKQCRDVYRHVKTAAERSLGILTQCIKEDKVLEARGAVVNGLVGQINAKLRGHNNCVQSVAKKPLEGNVMVVGGCIMNGGKDSRDLKRNINVAGVAASCNSEGFQHAGIWKYQNRGDIIIRSLTNIMFQLIGNYQKSGIKKAPRTIMYYRMLPDEELFDEVEQEERKMIEKACHRIHFQYAPKIIFIGTVRRHRVKFFPDSNLIKTGMASVALPGLNVPPGTVVDKKIVHRLRREFFMVSQCVREGVAQPTKYILSNCDIQMDRVQSITYHLTHLHALGYQSVSYVPSLHYAYRVAEKGKIYIKGLSASVSRDRLEKYSNRKRPKQEFVKAFPMYFL